ncbi:DrmB family protein [Persephonella sp.]
MEIRRSQFIRTYGPGAIIETPQTPAVILSFNTGSNPPDFIKSGYLIKDPILESYLKSIIRKYIDSDVNAVDFRVKIFELPSSSNESPIKFAAKNFQKWYLCPVHNNLWKYKYPEQTNCPDCTGDRPTNSTPVRFVQACKNGHLDDIQWDKEVHTVYRDGKPVKRIKCDSILFKWGGPGTGTAETEIKCMKCKSPPLKLIDLYNRQLECTKRYPEKELPKSTREHIEEKCDDSAQVILRMASNLRIPEIESIFMVWPRSDRLGLILSSNIAMSTELLKIIEFYEKDRLSDEELKEEFLNIIERYYREQKISKEEYDLLKKNKNKVLSLKDRLDYIRKIENKTYSYRDILDIEYEHLKKGAEKGFIEEVIETGRKYLEINHNKTINKNYPSVTPIDILTVVEVQVAYRRIDLMEGKPVLVSKTGDDNTHYFPSIMITGEGIFFNFDKINLQKTKTYNLWLEAFNNRYTEYNQGFLFKIEEEKYELHPVFVFLHTFAHLLIKSLSLYSGYPSTSIREKIYITDTNSDTPSGGVVIYTATEDEGGAMGGLISLVEEERLKKIFNRIKNLAYACSNDPVCKENTFRKGGYAGASCYSCTAISETSCDHRNLWLDRNLFIENINLLEGWL